jgi:hypothetical protein
MTPTPEATMRRSNLFLGLGLLFSVLATVGVVIVLIRTMSAPATPTSDPASPLWFLPFALLFFASRFMFRHGVRLRRRAQEGR